MLIVGFLVGCVNGIKVDGETLYPVYGEPITVDTYGWSANDETFEFDWNDMEILYAQETGAEFADATVLRLMWLTAEGAEQYAATSSVPNDGDVVCDILLMRDDDYTWAFEADPTACIAVGFALPEAGAIAANVYLMGEDGEVENRADFTGVWGGYDPSSTP